ncbi:MAG: preprotein translocase subunit SecE [bacterium]|nr:preprotein translocase subunit SecE [bacterium]
MNPMVWVQTGRSYLAEVRTEFNKITWPGQREYVGGTVGVIVIVAFLTLVLALIDAGLTNVMELLLD